MIVLGVNSVYHETAAAVVIDGQLVAAAEEERYNRRKHGKPALVENPHEVPRQAIGFCLRAAGIEPRDIDAVAYSFDPNLRREKFVYDHRSNKGDWGDRDGETVFRQGLDAVPGTLSQLLGRDLNGWFHWVPHHTAHAASTYYPAEYDDAAILVADGIAEHAATFLASGENCDIRPIAEIEYPHSIGFLWEKLCKFLGFSEYDACKVMGLAAYGDARHFAAAFRSFVHIDSDGFAMDPDVLEFRTDTYAKLEERLGARRLPGEPITRDHADVAAALQACNDELVLGLVRRLYELRPSRRLCFAGGVALNCTSNFRIKEEGPFDEIYIPPAPHDAGTAVGAALYVAHTSSRSRTRHTPSPYLGPDFGDDVILHALRANALQARKPECVEHEAAALLADGKIVGWFQGRMEFGPRALGNRSLLADPRRPDSRTRMNNRVKRREPFRPFAPSVLEEKAGEWFEIGKPSASFRYMLFACPARPDKAALIPAVLHTDGTARIQVVEQALNPRYHAMISRFEELTGVPLVLNTSYNDSEPIVCTPDDAVRTFIHANIDALVLGDYLVTRDSMSSSEASS